MVAQPQNRPSQRGNSDGVGNPYASPEKYSYLWFKNTGFRILKGVFFELRMYA